MTAARFATLEEWLAWQEGLHPQLIDLGLERLERVLQRLHTGPAPYTVITVGGTNGKGSSVAFLDATLRAAGHRVGAYTSPHLLRYNERIRIDGREVDDAALCEAFARIDAARGDISLTYFEFGTLAAFEIFRGAAVEVAILEVGLGGRLDAVNALDADAALITSIDIDHVEWLGPDRESIGREKAGIFRRGRPAVCADPDPPQSLKRHAQAIGAELYLCGRDYGLRRGARGWSWWGPATRLESLPLPALAGEHQLANAAAALMTLASLAERVPVTVQAIHAGLTQARIAGRFQILPGPVEWILDVTHNPHGAGVLARCLEQRPCSGRTRVVLGMLSDKDAVGVARALQGLVDHWYAASLHGPRGREGADLAAVLESAGMGSVPSFPSVEEACRGAAREAADGDRIVVLGSFCTVAEVLAAGLPGARMKP